MNKQQDCKFVLKKFLVVGKKFQWQIF